MIRSFMRGVVFGLGLCTARALWRWAWRLVTLLAAWLLLNGG